MKNIKSFLLFENWQSDDQLKEFIRAQLFDISDLDIPVSVDIFTTPIPRHEEDFTLVDDQSLAKKRCLILIGDEFNPVSSNISLHLYIENLVEIDSYLTDLGWEIISIACWINPISETVTQTRPISARSFSQFLDKIYEVKAWNDSHDQKEWKTFKLVDIGYSKG